MSGRKGSPATVTGGPLPSSARARVDEDGSGHMTRRRVAGRRVTFGVVGLALVLGLGLGACAQSNTPEEYNTLTNQNFLETCTNYYFENTDDSLSQTGNTVTADVTNPPNRDQCQCAYEVFAGPGGDVPPPVPINSSTAKTDPNYNGPNFTDLNAELKSDPQKAWDNLPDDIKTAVNGCISGSGATTSTTASSGDGSTTTTATDGATTTTGA